MIDQFRDKYFFLSNFYPSKENTLEHEYQAAKFLNPEHQAMILSQPRPGKAKTSGKRAYGARVQTERLGRD